jgi:hypothetical protein
VAADHQDDTVQQYQYIEQRGESERAVGKSKYHGSDDGRSHLKNPGKTVFGLNARPDKNSAENDEPEVFDGSSLIGLRLLYAISP